jgi:tetratricopeptide (TPR) repeat protein
MKLKKAPEPALLRLLRDAGAAWQRQDYDEHFHLLEKASRLAPANHGLLLDIGAAYGQRYDYGAAEKYFERSVGLAPNKSDALAMAGLHCRGFGRYEMARHYFERAIQEKGAPADTFVKLAELYERFRFPQEAAQLVNRALEMDQNCALALFLSARLDRMAGRLEQAEKLLRSLVARQDADTWSTRVRAWYELGMVLDGQGRFDDAMKAFLEAKAMIRPNAAGLLSSQKAAQARMNEAAADISAETLRRWFEAGQDLQPRRKLALLCGHPRSGTTLLEQMLDSHPAIVSAEETAVFFQDVYLQLRRDAPEGTTMLSSLEAAPLNRLKQLRDAYFRNLESFHREPLGERLLIDKNPSLTGLIPAFARVFPEAKFLIALRDPRDVCLSCFMQPFPLNQVSAMFLGLESTVAEYASVMGLWTALAPRMSNPGLEIRYEDVVENFESCSRRVLEFLQIPWDPSVLRFNEHARQKLVRSPTYSDVMKPIFKGAVGRWRNYQKYLEPHLGVLAPFLKAFGYE